MAWQAWDLRGSRVSSRIINPRRRYGSIIKVQEQVIREAYSRSALSSRVDGPVYRSSRPRISWRRSDYYRGSRLMEARFGTPRGALKKLPRPWKRNWSQPLNFPTQPSAMWSPNEINGGCTRNVLNWFDVTMTRDTSEAQSWYLQILLAYHCTRNDTWSIRLWRNNKFIAHWIQKCILSLGDGL